MTAYPFAMLEKLPLVSVLRLRERWDLGSNEEVAQVFMPPEGRDYPMILERLYTLSQFLEVVLNDPDHFTGARSIRDHHWEQRGYIHWFGM